ncbi:hypothetical protein SUGI_0477580 [Cryptomeria japonica]|nr:hypothetical protein SUGI_0477580 [Cryptomeria japonica]
MSKEVEKISAQVCVGCSIKDIHGLLIPTIISSGISEKKTQKKTNNGGRIPSGTREFEIATSLGLIDGFFTNHECIPSMKSAYLKFKQVYPAYESTGLADEIRDKEYSYLESNNHVCMDYSGFGLYSHHQYHHDVFPSSFSLSYLSANLPSHALYGAAESGTLEFQIKNRIMKFIRIQEKDDYSVVFTGSRGSSFGLLAESYPFHVNKRLLTVYDYENEEVDCMVESAKIKGAKTMSALFKWPSLRICSDEMKRALMIKKRKIAKEASSDSAEGLFVFPVQSRVTGAKYSYEWMSHAQRNGWHVLLDASALGSKDMDSLGLSLVMPEFIVFSFYKVYGENPTGFGCLFIKKSVIPYLHTSSAARGIGMVKIVPICKGISTAPANNEIQEGLCSERPDANGGSKNKQLLTLTSSSGPISELHKGDQAQSSVINITESDHSQKSDTESLPGTKFGSKTGSFCFQHASSSFDITSSSDGGARFFRNRGGYWENESIFFKQENLEGIAEQEEKWKDHPVPNSDFMNCNGIQENDESMHLGHPRENIKNKNKDPIETSGICREPSSPKITETRFTDPCDTVGTGKYHHGAPLENESECLQNERVNGNSATKLADRSSISLGYGVLHNIYFSEKYQGSNAILETKMGDAKSATVHSKPQGRTTAIPVVSAALSFVNNFEDVYRLWAFVAKFLDADFVDKERWRYRGLNQKTVEL